MQSFIKLLISVLQKGEKKNNHVSVPDPEISFKTPLLRARNNGNRKATMNFKRIYIS